jgi:hypothetical protein
MFQNIKINFIIQKIKYKFVEKYFNGINKEPDIWELCKTNLGIAKSLYLSFRIFSNKGEEVERHQKPFCNF